MTAVLMAHDLRLPGRLFDATLELRKGELACLIGPNGSGKTSLLHALAGIGRPGGEVEINGTGLKGASGALRRRLLSFLPATRDVKWPLAARDLIALGGAAPDAIENAIRDLELETVAGCRMDRLSTGERSRVLIARALAPAPALLLFDEPTANLDPLWQIRLMEMLKQRIALSGAAALIAIHDLDSAARYADRIILVDQGRIVADGAPADVLESLHIRDIFGIERRNGEWTPVIRTLADPRSSP